MLNIKRIAALFWMGSAIAIAVMVANGPSAWDTNVYWTAAQSLAHGGDPYTEGIAVQRQFHDQATKDPHVHPPMTYVYSPITLPALRWVSAVPARVAGTAFFVLLVGGFVLQLWAGWQMATESERRWLAYLLPAVAFFPGLLNDDVLLSGNIAYLLYGLVLAAAVPGWKRNRWGLYFAAVLVASICKAPLLSLLALPVVLGRRQWLAACATAVAGLGLFFVQAKLWPNLFDEYLRAVQLQFDWNADFGMSPAGILGKWMVQHGMQYKTPTTIVYLCFAGIIGMALLWIARRIHAYSSSVETWVPVALIGTVLLNPRVKEYDVAALTIPMLLIAARLLLKLSNLQRQTTGTEPTSTRLSGIDLPLCLATAGWFLVINVASDGDAWKPIELVLLVLLFGSGTWLSLSATRNLERCTPSPSLARAGGAQNVRWGVGESCDRLKYE